MLNDKENNGTGEIGLVTSTPLGGQYFQMSNEIASSNKAHLQEDVMTWTHFLHNWTNIRETLTTIVIGGLLWQRGSIEENWCFVNQSNKRQAVGDLRRLNGNVIVFSRGWY